MGALCCDISDEAPATSTIMLVPRKIPEENLDWTPVARGGWPLEDTTAIRAELSALVGAIYPFTTFIQEGVLRLVPIEVRDNGFCFL